MNKGTLRLAVIFALLITIPAVAIGAGKVIPAKTTTPEGDKSQTTRQQTEQPKATVDVREATPAEAMAGEEINWHVISGGGTDASSTNFSLTGTIGQTATGSALSVNHTLHHGYWQVFFLGGDDCCGHYTAGYTGNTNCDIEGKRNLADIAKLVDRVYISKLPLCCEPEGNVNGDIERKLNLADIARLVDHVYISKVETELCM